MEEKLRGVDWYVVDRIINAAKKFGVDPNLALAVGYQESTLGKYDKDNPMRVRDIHGAFNELPLDIRDKVSDDIDLGVAYLKYKMDNSPRQESLINRLQAYEGFGKITKKYRAKQLPGVKKLFGQPIKSIDTRKDPIYGRTVTNLMENFIRLSPGLQDRVSKYGALKRNIKRQVENLSYSPFKNLFLK